MQALYILLVGYLASVVVTGLMVAFAAFSFEVQACLLTFAYWAIAFRKELASL